MVFLAMYDTPDAGVYERHVVRIARTWLRMQGARFPVKRIVDGIQAELAGPTPAGYGCGWDELKKQFGEWVAGVDVEAGEIPEDAG